MVVDASDFGDHSKRITEDYDDEIARRCAISRKYYNLFHFIKKVAQTHFNVTFYEKGRDHGIAEEFTRNLLDDDERYFELMRLRHKSDYDIDKDISSIRVDAAQYRLETLIDDVEDKIPP